MEHFKFIQNRKCEFFPCHSGMDSDTFNCLFCYCPLYALGNNCGGNFRYTKDGLKDCSQCILPHKKENYDLVCQRLAAIVQMVKSNGNSTEMP